MPELDSDPNRLAADKTLTYLTRCCISVHRFAVGELVTLLVVHGKLKRATATKI